MIDIDINSSYQAMVFAKLKDITPTPDNTVQITQLFREFDYLPSTFQEIGPSTPVPVTRLMFITTNFEWIITIGVDRMSIHKNPLDSLGSNMGSLDDFTGHACKVFKLFLEHFDMKAFRVSLVTNGLLGGMMPQDLNEVYVKFCKPFNFYSKNSPIEWTFRSAAKVNCDDVCGMNEIINVITNLGRSQGRLLQDNLFTTFDRITVGFDINSIPENSTPRLEGAFIEKFFSSALSFRERLLSDIGSVIYG